MSNFNRSCARMSFAVVSLWRSLKQSMLDDYRPELHYMRGPGPKWRAKHQHRSEPAVGSRLADAAL
jgi:hypothetical protein